MEDEEASFSQTTTAEPSPSLADHRERTLFNVYDKHENFLDKPPAGGRAQYATSMILVNCLFCP